MLVDRFREVFEYRDGMLFHRRNVGGRADGSRAGNVDSNGYWQVSVDGKRHQEHRVVFAIHHSRLPPQVDHIDGNKLNNRIENLREANNAQNHWNTGLRATNTSGVKGVCFHKQSGKWQALCRFKGKQHCLGLFDSVADAGRVLSMFRSEHHGQFANDGARAHNIRSKG